MDAAPRVYDAILDRHLSGFRQMAFVSGPRQVGKTTSCRGKADFCLNWDNPDDRADILAGPARVAGRAGLDRLSARKPVILFDEIHKYAQWKGFLKGFFDGYSDRTKAIVTGSSRMDTYRRGGDSLMGRYFLYDMHPYSIAEVTAQDLPDPNRILRQPKPIDDASFEALWQHGGYPEPFLKRDLRFSRQWRSLRLQQLVREDIRDTSQFLYLDQLESLTLILAGMSAQQLSYTNLSKRVRVSIDTIKRWIASLRQFHFGFVLRPWARNIPRSLLKEPKWFLRDWATIEDVGSRTETFVACHLLKAVDCWNCLGLGDFGLFYIRDKEQREVDFLVVRDGVPWMLVEAKHGEGSLNPALKRFQDRLNVPFAFQVVLDADFVDADCFSHEGHPLIVPARTFLSQLM